MGRSPKKGGNNADNFEVKARSVNEGGDHSSEVGDLFAEISPGDQISIERVAPIDPAFRGWLTTIPYVQGLDLQQEIHSAFGGGTYLVRYKRRDSNGRIVFNSGSATFQIAGEPKLPRSAHAAMVLPAQGGPVGPELQTKLLDILTAQLGNNKGDEATRMVEQILGLIGSKPAAAQVDPLAQLLAAAETGKQLAGMFGGSGRKRNPSDDDDDDDDDDNAESNPAPASAMDQMMMMMMAKFLGGGAPTPQVLPSANPEPHLSHENRKEPNQYQMRPERREFASQAKMKEWIERGAPQTNYTAGMRPPMGFIDSNGAWQCIRTGKRWIWDYPGFNWIELAIRPAQFMNDGTGPHFEPTVSHRDHSGSMGGPEMADGPQSERIRPSMRTSAARPDELIDNPGYTPDWSSTSGDDDGDEDEEGDEYENDEDAPGPEEWVGEFEAMDNNEQEETIRLLGPKLGIDPDIIEMLLSDKRTRAQAAQMKKEDDEAQAENEGVED